MFGIDVAIKKLRPNAEFEITNSFITYWNDPDGLPQPTWEEVLEQLKKDKENINGQFR